MSKSSEPKSVQPAGIRRVYVGNVCFCCAQSWQQQTISCWNQQTTSWWYQQTVSCWYQQTMSRWFQRPGLNMTILLTTQGRPPSSIALSCSAQVVEINVTWSVDIHTTCEMPTAAAAGGVYPWIAFLTGLRHPGINRPYHVDIQWFAGIASGGRPGFVRCIVMFNPGRGNQCDMVCWYQHDMGCWYQHDVVCWNHWWTRNKCRWWS